MPKAELNNRVDGISFEGDIGISMSLVMKTTSETDDREDAIAFEFHQLSKAIEPGQSHDEKLGKYNSLFAFIFTNPESIEVIIRCLTHGKERLIKLLEAKANEAESEGLRETPKKDRASNRRRNSKQSKGQK
jgi:hypothetical protein